MKNLYHQTKQAFFFSLAFYFLAIVTLLAGVPFAPVLISISLLVSLIWTILVLREILMSTKVSNAERLLIILFIIMTNIIGGIVYFFLLRDRIIDTIVKKQ